MKYSQAIAVAPVGGHGLDGSSFSSWSPKAGTVGDVLFLSEAMRRRGRRRWRRRGGLCEPTGLPQGLRITTHIADVSDEAQVPAVSRRRCCQQISATSSKPAATLWRTGHVAPP